MENNTHKIMDGISPSREEYTIHITLLISHIGQHQMFLRALRMIPIKETNVAKYPRYIILSI